MQARARSASVRHVEAQKAKSRAVWLWALVPAFGLFELGLHVWQVQRALTSEDWDRAVAELRTHIAEADGIVVAPDWAEPVARRALGSLATEERMAVADYTRYKTVWELSVDDATVLPSDWLKVPALVVTPTARRIHVRQRTNPTHNPVVTDLLTLASRGSDSDLTVTRGTIGAETPCVWHRGVARVEADHEAWGPARGAHYAECTDGTKLSVQVVPDHDWRPRRCFLVPTTGAGSRTRLVFHNVVFSGAVWMHTGLHGYSEDRQNHGLDVTTWVGLHVLNDANEQAEWPVGSDTHRDGEGWKRFEIEDLGIAWGTIGDLLVDISSDASGRLYCFEGSTR